MAKARPKKLSDFCKECEALKLLKRIVRDGDYMSMAPAKRFLDKKLGPDPNRDQPEGHEAHPGMRRFDLVEYKMWNKPQWMEDTGMAEYWSNCAGGKCPKGTGMKIIDTKWHKDWTALWDEVGEPEEGR